MVEKECYSYSTYFIYWAIRCEPFSSQTLIHVSSFFSGERQGLLSLGDKFLPRSFPMQDGQMVSEVKLRLGYPFGMLAQKAPGVPQLPRK